MVIKVEHNNYWYILRHEFEPGSRRKERSVPSAVRKRRATQPFDVAQDGELVEPKPAKGVPPFGPGAFGLQLRNIFPP
jgi:hypothetical protein